MFAHFRRRSSAFAFAIFTRNVLFNVRLTAHKVRPVSRAQFALRKRSKSVRNVIIGVLCLVISLVALSIVGLAQVANPPVVVAPPAVEPGMRHVQLLPRSDLTQIQTFPNTATGERIIVVTGGVTILIEGLPTRVGQLTVSGSIDVSADRIVIWSAGSQPGLGQSQPTAQPNGHRWKSTWKAISSSAKAIASCRPRRCTTTCATQRRHSGCRSARAGPRAQGLLRLKADVMRQLDEHHFVAENASFTTSRMGIPTYEFKSGTLMLEDNQVPSINPLTGQPEVDDAGQPIVEHDQLYRPEQRDPAEACRYSIGRFSRRI